MSGRPHVVVVFVVETGPAADVHRWNPVRGPYIRRCAARRLGESRTVTSRDRGRLLAVLEAADWIVGHDALTVDLAPLAVHAGAD